MILRAGEGVSQVRGQDFADAHGCSLRGCQGIVHGHENEGQAYVAPTSHPAHLPPFVHLAYARTRLAPSTGYVVCAIRTGDCCMGRARP